MSNEAFMEENTDINDRIADYFLSGDNGVSDPVLMEWLDGSKANRKLFGQYERIWNESRHYVEKSVFDPEAAWKKVHRINREREKAGRLWRRVYYTVSGAAAAVFVMLALSGVFGEEERELSVSMKADYGSRAEIMLPDGTAVKLNSGSDLTYSFNSRENIREVSFQGEGFFDVSKSTVPFVIRIKDGPEVRVLGTAFNLQAYPEDPLVRTSLVEGSVELVYKDTKQVMKPKETVAFDRKTNQLRRMDGILSHTYSWLENKLYMDEMLLTDVCRYLERRYGVHITVHPDVSENIHFNGVLQEETILDALKALSGLSKVKYAVKGKNISITPK